MYFSPKIAALLATLLATSAYAAPALDINEVNGFNVSTNALDTRESGTGDGLGCVATTECKAPHCCQVKLTCWSIPGNVKAYGILDVHGEVDTWTNYMEETDIKDGPTTFWSDCRNKDWSYHPESRVGTKNL